MQTRKNLLTNLGLMMVGMLSLSGNAMEQSLTKEFKLDNGLKVVVREDHRAPVVVSQIWYKVGASDETRWITGISHALEHMMFQGTPNLPGDGFAELISRYGGQNNAFTAEDFTAYYEELDASNLAISFEAEADRMSHLLLQEEAFAKEIQVVIEERRLRTDDNPQNVAYERFMAAAFPMGPYHHPVIGWQVDLDKMTVNDLRRWYESWYTPDNATLVVVGDVKADDVFALAKQHFGSVKNRPMNWDVRSQQEIEPLGEKRIKVHQRANVPYAIWGYVVPSIKTTQDSKEVFALLVASAVLDGGDSARFAKELIRNQSIASNISVYYDPFKKYDSQFMIAGNPAEGRTIANLEEKVMAQIELLKTELVPASELARVKAQVLAQEIFGRDSMSDQATRLGMFESIGLSWKLSDQITERVNAVTAEEIQAVAKKYLVNKRLTVAELIPENTAEAS